MQHARSQNLEGSGGTGPPGSPDGPLAASPSELARLVERTEGIQPWRRVFHATNGVITAVVLARVLTERWTALLGLGVILAGALLIDLVRLRDPRANVLFFRWLRPFASPREERRVASSTWYMIGIVLAVLLFPHAAVIPAVLVLGFADPVASVTGRRWGRRPLGKGSVEGTTVFALVAFLVLLPFVGPWPAVAGALVGAVVEILPTGLDDNLTIPLAVAGVLTLLG